MRSNSATQSSSLDSGLNQYFVKNRDFEEQALPQLEDLYRTALYIVGNERDAQDLVQESVIRAYHAGNGYKFGPSYRMQLFKIMVNTYINKYRPFPSLSDAINSACDVDGELIDLEALQPKQKQQTSKFELNEVLIAAISEDDISAAVKHLPDGLRVIVVLSLLNGFSYQEIAGMVGVRLETVRTRIRHGRELIKGSCSKSTLAEAGGQ